MKEAIDCTPKVYTVGMTFVDEGGEHVHVIREPRARLRRGRLLSSCSRPDAAAKRSPANPACGF